MTEKTYDRELVVEFVEPIIVNGTTYDSITLRPPKVGQMRDAKNKGKDDDIGVVAQLICSIAGVDMPVVNQMEMPDFNAAAEYLAHFLGSPTR